MADQKITVIVFSARGLKGKKKGNTIRADFSVIFGVGKSKFRTEVVEDQDGSPEWNTQSEISVESNKHPLLLVVTEKDNVLGQLSLPLHELPTAPTRQRIVTALGPHKKCPAPSGELVYSAYISSATNAEGGALTPVIKKRGFAGSMENFGKPLKKIKEKLSHSPMLKRKMSLRRAPGGDDSDSEDRDSLGSLNSLASSHSLSSQKGSVSMLDLSKAQGSPILSGANRGGLATPPTAPKSKMKGAASMSILTIPTQITHRRSSSYDLDTLQPEVSGISPKEGPIEGGTRLTIRGANLGKNKADVVGLFVCGSNVLGSVEYESPSKLFFTTKPWKPSTGNIVLETQSGGKGTSLVQFTFTEPPPPPEPEVDPSHPPAELTIITPPPKPKRKPKDTKDMFDLTKPTALPEEAASTVTKHRRSGSTASDNSATLVILPPEVSGISPREGSTEGGTRLTVRGCNMGNCAEDIIGLFVCGCNCLASLEYDSPSKIFCTTRRWHAGSGSILIETQGGGRGSSLVEFKFVAPPAATPERTRAAETQKPPPPEVTVQDAPEPPASFPKQATPSSGVSVPTSNVAVVSPLGSTTTTGPPQPAAAITNSRFYVDAPTPPDRGPEADAVAPTSNPFDAPSSNPFDATVPANAFGAEEPDTQFRAIPFEPDLPATEPESDYNPFNRVVTKPPKGPAPRPPVSQPPQPQLPAPILVIPHDGPSEKELMYKHRCEQLEVSNQLLKDQVQVLRMENKVRRDSNASMNEYIERLVAIVIEKCPECLNRDLSTSHLSASHC